MAVSARFQGPAHGLDLNQLLNKGLKITVICALVALAAHSAFLVRSLDWGKEEISKPLTTRFVQRQPRLTKPMEMRKKPKPRQRKMVRQQVKLQARTTRMMTTQVGGISLRSLAAPDVSLDTGAELVAIDLGSRTADIGVTTSKEPDNKIDMREQLLDLNFLDTGEYQAMVIQDPNDKRNIQGYFHIAQAYSARMIESKIQSFIRSGDSGTSMLQNPHAVQNLVDALNEYTNIQADFSSRMPLSSQELMQTPWVFIPAVSFTLTEGELSNLGKYLQGGGFILADAGTTVGGNTDSFLRLMIRDALGTVGQQARFKRLPSDHPVYHTFFDFDGPPRALLGGPGIGASTAGEGRNNVDYLVGVEVDGRLAVVISYQNIGVAWENLGYRNDKGLYSDNTRHLQFGINTIVFALTQEGSITNRVMEIVR
ncbi:MAG: DUF4159 domain-containing protein [Candidatus Latescibacteria bacterium]|nr:DUF4159 domain-containing protein [Candidatus Latescibacterota bacterium]